MHRCPQVRKLYTREKTAANTTPYDSAFLVNAFPWMEHIPDWVPGTGWKQKAYEWREQTSRAMGDPYNWAKQRIVS
jgi:hypothetical protein